jgi:hypothetical protein
MPKLENIYIHDSKRSTHASQTPKADRRPFFLEGGAKHDTRVYSESPSAVAGKAASYLFSTSNMCIAIYARRMKLPTNAKPS